MRTGDSTTPTADSMTAPSSSARAREVTAWLALAVRLLRRRRALIDGVNVFPVADHDTGSNVLRTLEAGLRAAATHQPDGAVGGGTSDEGCDSAVAAISNAVLRGSRGSSGTIVASMVAAALDPAAGLRAMAAGESLRPSHVAACLAAAAAAGRRAVAEPIEGTILTVADAVADAAAGVASAAEAGQAAEPPGWEGFATTLVGAAQTALAATAHRWGTVDAGAAAYVTLVEALALRVAPGRGSDGRSQTAGECDDALTLLRQHRRSGAQSQSPDLSQGVRSPSPPTASVRYELLVLLRAAAVGAAPDSAAVGAALPSAPGSGAADVVVTAAGRDLRVHAHVDDVPAALRSLSALAAVVDVQLEPLLADLPSPVPTPDGATAGRRVELSCLDQPWQLSPSRAAELLAGLGVARGDVLTVTTTPAIPPDVVDSLRRAASRVDVAVQVRSVVVAPLAGALLRLEAT
ncbi:MAG: DAK2 domain-containing protein [Actinomycetales bacterium]